VERDRGTRDPSPGATHAHVQIGWRFRPWTVRAQSRRDRGAAVGRAGVLTPGPPQSNRRSATATRLVRATGRLVIELVAPARCRRTGSLSKRESALFYLRTTGFLPLSRRATRLCRSSSRGSQPVKNTVSPLVVATIASRRNTVPERHRHVSDPGLLPVCVCRVLSAGGRVAGDRFLRLREIARTVDPRRDEAVRDRGQEWPCVVSDSKSPRSVGNRDSGIAMQ
jgi:hypothetical protein